MSFLIEAFNSISIFILDVREWAVSIINQINATSLQYTFSTIPQVIATIYGLSAIFIFNKIEETKQSIYESQRLIKKCYDCQDAPHDEYHPMETVHGHRPTGENNPIVSEIGWGEFVTDLKVTAKIPILDGFWNLLQMLSYLKKFKAVMDEVNKEIKLNFKRVSIWMLISILTSVLFTFFSNSIIDYHSKLIITTISCASIAIYSYYQWVLIKISIFRTINYDYLDERKYKFERLKAINKALSITKHTPCVTSD